MCGKYDFWKVERQKVVGSPPHVREILIASKVAFSQSRITPACAGNTLSSQLLFGHNQDHPRMCGKYWEGIWKCCPPLGSPPHVREIPCRDVVFSLPVRITPACAGNTLKDPSMTLPAI